MKIKVCETEEQVQTLAKLALRSGTNICIYYLKGTDRLYGREVPELPGIKKAIDEEHYTYFHMILKESKFRVLEADGNCLFE